MRKEITEELALISGIVSAIPFGNVYSIPEDYFQTLPTQILGLVTAEATTNPLISSINRAGPQDVPDGYFNSLAANILKKALASDEEAAMEIKTISPHISEIGKSMPYVLPDGFFNHFPNIVINTIQGDIDNQDETPVFLQDLRDKNPYTVPENYFTTLAPLVIGKISAPAEAKVVKMFSFRKVIQYASAAVIAGVILAGTMFYFQGSSDDSSLTNPQISSFDSIPIEELERYVSNQPAINNLNTSVYASAELENEDIREILFDVPEADLQQYLVNYTDLKIQNIN